MAVLFVWKQNIRFSFPYNSKKSFYRNCRLSKLQVYNISIKRSYFPNVECFWWCVMESKNMKWKLFLWPQKHFRFFQWGPYPGHLNMFDLCFLFRLISYRDMEEIQISFWRMLSNSEQSNFYRTYATLCLTGEKSAHLDGRCSSSPQLSQHLYGIVAGWWKLKPL